jgi:chromosomal replication initiation ATPase DnaA
MPHPPSIWDGVLRRFQSELPAFALDAWITPLQARERDGELVVSAPSAFHRDRIAARYLSAIERHAASEAGCAVKVVLLLGSIESKPSASQIASPGAAVAGVAGVPATVVATNETLPRGERSVPAQPSLPYRFDSFVVGASNALAR